MKPYQYRFEKVLNFREQEKTDTEMEFKKSIESFEAVANELYEVLKKKEEATEKHQLKLAAGFCITEIHQFAHFIDSLEKRIDTLQQSVIKARSKMNWYEEKLLEKSIEVKKYEKMREKDKEHYRTEMEQTEATMLDELSTLKFQRRETGW